MTDTFIHITAGGGPKECQWVVVQLACAYAKDAKIAGLKAEILWDDENETLAPSLMIKVSGRNVESFIQPRLGTIRWIGHSPFRNNHKRKNWYVGVSKTPNIKDVPDLNPRDIVYQTLKASGPGGQHVNKTESAVRATHTPTGLTVTASAERSQFANKKLTRIKLAMLLKAQKLTHEGQQKNTLWSQHKTLERGNETRIYEGKKFKLLKRSP